MPNEMKNSWGLGHTTSRSFRNQREAVVALRVCQYAGAWLS